MRQLSRGWIGVGTLGGLVLSCFTALQAYDLLFPGRVIAYSPLTSLGVMAAPQDDTQDAADEVTTRNITRSTPPILRINTTGHTGTVQALVFSPDSKRLLSGGLDKVVQVWNVNAFRAGVQTRDIKRATIKERTIRWQVSRGPRGAVYALAAAPNDGLVAIAGYGAMGGTGEILLVDPVEGTLQKVLEGHRQSISALAFTADGEWLLSADVAGETRLWKRGEWQPRVVYDPDTQTYGPARAQRIQSLPLLRAATTVGSNWIAVPVYVGTATGDPVWKVQLISLTNRKSTLTLDTPHKLLVTALAATPNGRQLASADGAGNTYLWDLSTLTDPPPVPFRLNPVPLPQTTVLRSLAYRPDGQLLAAGSAVDPKTNKAQVQLWDLTTRKVTATFPAVSHVTACAISPDGQRLAYVGGERNEVFVQLLAGHQPAPQLRSALQGSGRKIYKVAFAAQEPLYRVAFGTEFQEGTFNDYAPLAETFNLATSDLQRGANPLKAAEWRDAQKLNGSWRALPDRVDPSRVTLSEAGQPRGVIQLDLQAQGRCRCYCLVADAAGKPYAIALGTDKQNSVYIYRLSAADKFPLLRQFRGHQDYVTSLSVSADRKYLASSSADGTINLWSLLDLEQGRTVKGRWGAELTPAKDAVVVKSIHEAGPLYRRGLREGDLITQIRWHDGQTEHSEKNPQKIATLLETFPLFTQVVFEFSRQQVAKPAFQLLPAWQPVASLFVSDDREWAYWTPEGYYDASINGHTLFGWQVNRGLNQLPQFYRADQYRKTLERPDIMHKLLSAGSLEAAFRAVEKEAPAEAHQLLPQQFAVTPTLTITTPRMGQLLAQQMATVRARVQMAAEVNLAQTRVFANGVVATRQNLVEQKDDPQTKTKEVVYEWTVPLTAENRHLIQVFVSTQSKTSAFDQVLVDQPQPRQQPLPRKPRLYLLAIGVNQYQDENIPDLDYSVADAQSVLEGFKTSAQPLYELKQSKLLANEQVSRTTWTESFAQLTTELRKDDILPDDLLVIFMAGHGEVDDNQTYHYLCYNTALDTLFEGNSTISWKDFDKLADIPCRKLALLDTCHSGAIQSAAPDNKQAVREFQENVVLTVSASEAHELSQESTEWSHGAFTKELLAALGGAADTSKDGIVELEELVTYLLTSVPKLTANEQHPTAAPKELLDIVTLPLAQWNKKK